ncbi:MAG: hypothetical protein RIQ83_473 [Pseudomonadota bacterium]
MSEGGQNSVRVLMPGQHLSQSIECLAGLLRVLAIGNHAGMTPTGRQQDLLLEMSAFSSATTKLHQKLFHLKVRRGEEAARHSDVQTNTLLCSRLDRLLITLGNDLIALLHVAAQYTSLGAAIGRQGGIRVG